MTAEGSALLSDRSQSVFQARVKALDSVRSKDVKSSPVTEGTS